MTEIPLSQQHCAPLPKGAPVLAQEKVDALLAQIDSHWQLTNTGLGIERKVNVSNFAQALALANRCGALAEQEDHHPDMQLGWGYFTVHFTTHSVGGLSINDFICAARFDQLLTRRILLSG